MLSGGGHINGHHLGGTLCLLRGCDDKVGGWFPVTCCTCLPVFLHTFYNVLQGGGGLGGVFAQRGHSANYYVVYPGNTPENHPPTEACMIHSKSMGGAEFRTLGPVASIRLKQKSLVYQQGL